MGPQGQNAFSLQVGARPGGGAPLLLFSYRRFLGDWVSGRLRATLGADFDVAGTVLAVSPPIAGQPATGEFGSVMGGLQARLGGWGGSRYGGFSFRVETGVGVGRELGEALPHHGMVVSQENANAFHCAAVPELQLEHRRQS